MATRREILRSAAALGAVAGLKLCPAMAGDVVRLISAARINGRNGGALWSQAGLRDFPLPTRGHALTQLSNSRVVLVGRQPGTFAALVDPATLATPRPDIAVVKPAAHFRYGGHAAAHEGARGFVTGEFHEETGSGLIALRDTNGVETAHWDAGGIGPHDLLYAQGGARLVVALGGLLQEPDVHSPPLNAGTIESSLVVLDAKSGKILTQHKLPPSMASLSLRHLALAPDDETIAIGMQDQDLTEVRPVIGMARVGRGIELLPLSVDEPNAFRGYIGSLAIDASGRHIAATSPRGGVIGLWSLGDGRWLGKLHLADVCGLVPDTMANCFWATSGTGDIVRLSASENGLTASARFHADAAFDNHAITI
jgi:uncharacterized protein